MKRVLTTFLACLAMLGAPPTFAREFDAETGLVHMGYREYDPETGRFLQEDPEFHPSRNTFSYALNNPLLYIDPMGTDVILVREGYQNYWHQVVYINDPQNPGKYISFEFAPRDDIYLRLALPYDWPGYAFSSDLVSRIKGDELARIPQNPNQDAWSILHAKMFLNDPRWKHYNLYNNTCQDFAGSLYKHLTPTTIGPP
jgi:RHS repeat-associated protein